mgnify:CR=1 FL=1
MRKNLMVLALTVGAASFLFADGSGMGGGGMMAGSGMMIVADDSSLLVTSMDVGGMMGGGPGNPGTPGEVDRELVNIDANGEERWRVSFADGWPMMPVTDGGLVVVVLVDDWFMGSGGMGDGGWGGGHMGGGKNDGEDGPGDVESILVALDLATGEEEWRATISGDMASMAQFSPDGSRIYVSAREMGSGGGMGQGSMRQGDVSGAGFMSSSTIIAFDRSGNRMWTHDLGGE